eukprot:TRINITY_DN64307_c2_g1_i1.p3 TRINITY_DN64307_c2_g1~~TRINITY_DN64307_c2_g1_i1.p3  ORF type:complete len:361 (+),score=34.71 TRINITY_DN64307_c2_g1_i1:4206-5288(+)
MYPCAIQQDTDEKQSDNTINIPISLYSKNTIMPKKSTRGRKARPDHRIQEIKRAPVSHPHPPRKPLSASVLYYEERKPIMAKENPRLSRRARNLIAEKEWKTMSSKDREKYESLAQKENEEYKKKLNEYEQQRKELAKAKLATPAKKDLPPTITPPTCAAHNEPFKYWCKTCTDWICELCVTKHSSDGHSCVHLLDYAQETLLNDIASISGQNQASNGISKAISENMGNLVETFKRLISNYSLQLKVVGNTVESIESVNRKYRAANQNFMTRLEEMKTKIPDLIKGKEFAKLFDYLKKVETMKKATKTDDTDVKELEAVGSRLKAYIEDITKPLDLILESTKGITKKISGLSDIQLIQRV